ncbi:LD-carboxypeptidase LdcB/DacB [Streptococcus moroccensis]|uniref:D-alanyl-D-alanine carboxypeptidase n=1 Tax=Streptococcus moroccensis TaxID=1451356 RepID=A0ABT9YS54_9STRE|nr:LD-carboxypeptidase LdcB/DacB [Streptococcus moroccensis]MDQ0222822.1 D-alanyl-D-alanine carboxypeptidase [Streptococcus moroccensis]
MKKYASLGLTCLTLLTLVACTSKSEETKASSSAKTSQKATKSTSKATSSSQNTDASEDSHSDQSSSTGLSDAADNSSGSTAVNNGTYYSVTGKYGDEIIIVNKRHPLPASYTPGENPTALAAFQQLQADMMAQGFSISYGYSGFRSYETQTQLYQDYVARDGQSAADRYSARPGYSEHQTGLAFDLTDAAGNLLEEPQASAWLRDNAHHYGFVVRYLPEKESVTGYMPESWHVRYIGQEATDIYQSGLTLEEYYGVDGGDYAQ